MPKATSSGGGRTFQAAPAGVHQAVCVDVVDLGLVEVTWQGQTKRQHKVSLRWQIDEARDDGKPFLVSKRYTLSLSDRATLRRDLEAWRGRPFTDADLRDGFEVDDVLGANCLVNIVHRTKDGTTYANVDAIMPLVKGMPKLVARDYVMQRDRTDAAPPSPTQPADDAHDYDPPPLDDEIPF